MALELGAELERHYRDKAPVVLPVMTGALPFAADLIRAIRPRVKGLVVECVRAKSYFATSEVRAASVAVGDVGVDVRGRHVLLVEDIVDTGHTMEKLKAKVLENGAATVAMVSLLNKRARRVTGTQPEFAGFDCDDEFVVGYGLDFCGEFREVPYVGVLKPEVAASEHFTKQG